MSGKSKGKGFTLLELIIVVIVIGILASISMPRYIKIVEKGRVAEGKRLLGTFKDAQMRYSAQHGFFATNTNDFDIVLQATKYFVMSAATVYGSVDSSTALVATATRNSIDNPTGTTCVYQITQGGNISVASGGASCDEFL